jgi:hypothetical protein
MALNSSLKGTGWDAENILPLLATATRFVRPKLPYTLKVQVKAS